MLDADVNMYDKSKFFTPPRKHNNSGTTPSTEIYFDPVLLGSDTIKCQQYTKTHTTCQKPPLCRNEYIYISNCITVYQIKDIIDGC